MTDYGVLGGGRREKYTEVELFFSDKKYRGASAVENNLFFVSLKITRGENDFGIFYNFSFLRHSFR